MRIVEKNDEIMETRAALDDFEVGDGIYDTVTGKVYILAHDYEEPSQFPGHVLDEVPVSDDTDYDDDDDYSDDDEDYCDDTDGHEHGYFIFDPSEANQVTRLHRISPQAAIKSYFINGLKHDIVRIPACDLTLNYKLQNSK